MTAATVLSSPSTPMLALLPQVDPSRLPPTPLRREPPRRTSTEPADSRPRQLVAKFATVSLEVLQQRRGTKQLNRWLTDLAEVSLRAWSRDPIWQSATLGSVRACLINPEVVEGCFRVDLEDRSTMVTVRLERRRQTWVCTDFEPLCPPALRRTAA